VTEAGTRAELPIGSCLFADNVSENRETRRQFVHPVVDMFEDDRHEHGLPQYAFYACSVAQCLTDANAQDRPHGDKAEQAAGQGDQKRRQPVFGRQRGIEREP
jgi:hypothetical protein